MSAVLAGLLVVWGCWATRAVLVAGDRRRFLAHRQARRLAAPDRFARALADAAVPLDAGTAWTALLAVAAAAGGVGLLVGGIGLAAVAAVGAAGAPLLALAALSGRSVAQVEAMLPEVLDGVARSMRAGATVRGALVEVADVTGGRLGADLAAVLADADGGVALAEAFGRWTERCPTPGVRLAVAALGLSVEAGGPAARAVDGVAATLRANRAVAAEVGAQAAQARLSALVIAAAPVAFGLLAAGTDARTATFLLRTPVGLACLAGGLALDAVAAWWMHRITAAPA